MIQATPNGRAATTAAPIDQPFGFAKPKAPPLSVAKPAGPSAEYAPGIVPDGFAPPDEPITPLAAIEPAQSDHRNPAEPFVTGSVADESPAWHPTQPLPLSASALDTRPAETSPSQSRLPGPALDQLPPPTGRPVGVPPSPYPANPYAVGPYSGQPPMQSGTDQRGWPSPPFGAQPPGRPAQQPINLQAVLQASDIGVLTLLMAGLLWAQLAPFALLAAVLVAVFRSSQGWLLVLVAAIVALLVTLIWSQGYLATSQWQASAQTLCAVCLIGVPLVAYQSLRRWS